MCPMLKKARESILLATGSTGVAREKYQDLLCEPHDYIAEAKAHETFFKLCKGIPIFIPEVLRSIYTNHILVSE